MIILAIIIYYERWLKLIWKFSIKKESKNGNEIF